VAHFVCDYPLQGDFLSKAKSAAAPIAGVPWYQAMFAHSSIHAGAVWLVTGIWWLGIIELVAHFFIDYGKCAGRMTFNEDQAAHIICKITICLLWVYVT
jgi:hypothetical protein